MYNHTSHSKVIVTARRKQKAKYKMLVQTMFIVKLAHNVWVAAVIGNKTSVKLCNLLCSNIRVRVSHRLPRTRKKWEVKNTVRCSNGQCYHASVQDIPKHFTIIYSMWKTVSSSPWRVTKWQELFWPFGVLEVKA